jgi:hypothetical protein
MNKWLMRIVGISMLLGAGVAQAQDTRLFTGAGGDQNFSNTNNWDTAPVTGDNIYIAANGTSASTPAVIDSGFNTDPNLARIFSTGAGATGTAYVDVASGGTLKATAVYVGNSANQWYDGDLTVRSGGTVVARYPNSGLLEIGGNDAGSGVMTIDSGASVSHAMLNLKPNGTLIYEFGASSVPTFLASKFTAGGANTLDGLVKVNLSALVSEGSYTLIDGSSFAPIAGAMKTWLDGLGGSVSGTGDNAYANFEVVVGGTIDWTLSLEDGGQDLVLAVSGGGLEGPSFVLFSDTFDRADSSDVNLNSAANQSGSLAPLTYAVFSNNTPNVSAISSNEVLLSVDGNGGLRLVPQVDLSDSSAAIVEAGGFEVSYNVDSGVNFTNTIHGSYTSSLILSQESMVESAIGNANPWHGLFVSIFGNGQVRVYSQGAILLDAALEDWGTQELIDSRDATNGIGAHIVRLVVETDGFETTSANTFKLHINDLFVGSASFNWKTSSDLSVGLEALIYSAQFDNVEISMIAPEQFTTNGVPYSWLDSYYTGLSTDADYENAANTDTDGDGFIGQEEYRTGTDPTDPTSLFGFTGTELDPAGFAITWNSITGGLYTVSSSPGLVSPDWGAVASNIVGQVGETSYTSTVSGAKGFLKVELQ